MTPSPHFPTDGPLLKTADSKSPQGQEDLDYAQGKWRAHDVLSRHRSNYIIWLMFQEICSLICNFRLYPLIHMFFKNYVEMIIRWFLSDLALMLHQRSRMSKLHKHLLEQRAKLDQLSNEVLNKETHLLRKSDARYSPRPVRVVESKNHELLLSSRTFNDNGFFHNSGTSADLREYSIVSCWLNVYFHFPGSHG